MFKTNPFERFSTEIYRTRACYTMDAHKLPPISSLQSRPTDELIDVLDHLFEPSLSLHTLSLGLLRNEVFRSYDELIASVGGTLFRLKTKSTLFVITHWL